MEMNSLILLGSRLLSSMPDIPPELETLWNTDILGYTSIGGIVLFVGGFAYTLIKARIQRKAVAMGLTNATKSETIHYNEFVEYKVKKDIEIDELRNDVIALAKTSVRKEAKEIAEKWEKRARREKVKEVFEDAKPIIQEVINEVKKKKFR